jgi:hypothetical protein
MIQALKPYMLTIYVVMNMTMVIVQAFGIPEMMTQALKHYMLIRYAEVKVNGHKGILITIKTGSGQGDPLSIVVYPSYSALNPSTSS